ncbi:MAG: hypothetical protein EXQ54_00305 [Acidobacteria bacterium]|nr:hypothetical protein [Acidobacteriota bacterium]
MITPVEAEPVVEELPPVIAALAPVEAPVAFHVPEVPAVPDATDAPEDAVASELAPVLQMTRTVRIEVPPRSTAVRVSGVERLLRLAVARAASALFVTADSRPSIRVEGDVRPLDGEPPMTRAEVEAAVMEIVPEAEQEAVGRGEPTEWITEFADLGRIRCITFTDHRGPGVVSRLIATRAATAEQLGLSREVQALATEPQGLVLVAGAHGTGKSTLVSSRLARAIWSRRCSRSVPQVAGPRSAAGRPQARRHRHQRGRTSGLTWPRARQPRVGG